MLFPNSQGRHGGYCQWSYGEQPSPPGRLGVHLLLVRRQGTEQGTELAAAACGPTETSRLPVPDLEHSLRVTWRLTRSLRLDRRTISPSYWPSAIRTLRLAGAFLFWVIRVIAWWLGPVTLAVPWLELNGPGWAFKAPGCSTFLHQLLVLSKFASDTNTWKSTV